MRLPAGTRLGLGLALGLALAGTGCSITQTSTGRAALPDARSLQVGRSTKAEALAALGPPVAIHRQFDGDLLVWRRSELDLRRLLLIPFVPIYERTTGSSRSDMLTLLFDARGVLAGVGEQRDIGRD